MAEKQIIIIGAGVSGLSAGIYAQMNGYQARIFELHSIPGGMCTAWKRGGYTIDGCVHFLIGSAPGGLFHQWWREVGVLPGREFVHHDAEMRFEAADGRVVTFYNDLGRLREHLLVTAPGDRAVIEEFMGGMRFFSSYQPPVDALPELMGPLEMARFGLSMLPTMRDFQKWAKISIGDFALRFQSPLLRDAFRAAMHPDFPMMLLMMSLAWQAQGNAGYPIGGSLSIARAMERRFCSLGGDIHYHSRVVKILTEGNRAIGVRLENGREERADVVISAADGHSTLFQMLDERFLDGKAREIYSSMRVFPSLLYVSFGVNRAFEDPSTVSGTAIQLAQPVIIGGQTLHHLPAQVVNFDPTVAPPGKTVLTSAIWADYAYWKSLRADSSIYEAEKQRAMQIVLGLLEKRWPGISAQVEMVDVATPLTYERYTAAWQGSTQGWMTTTKTAMLQMRKTLPGLKNFTLIGQWTEPGGGLPTGLRSGRNAIRVLCHQDRRAFSATEA